MKQINELNLQAACDGLSTVLSEQLGGTFTVTLRKFEVPGNNLGDKMLFLNFAVSDNSHSQRYFTGPNRRYATIPQPPTPEAREGR